MSDIEDSSLHFTLEKKKQKDVKYIYVFCLSTLTYISVLFIYSFFGLFKSFVYEMDIFIFQCFVRNHSVEYSMQCLYH
jgi:hypothetical protein